jgi:hypothetical protein
MSQAPQAKNDWLKENYEKIVLMVAFVALLVSSVWLVKDVQVSKESATRYVSRIGWRGSPVETQDASAYQREIEQARESSRTQLETSPLTVVSEVRVSCVKCGKPIAFDASECPFCLAPQPAIVSTRDLDTDGDGVPDWREIELGTDPLNAADASGDLDGDGFTNLEEHQAGTDPSDPSSMHDPIVKLRVGRIRPVPFYLRFVGTQRMPDGTLRYQLNMQKQERTYFARIDEVVLGYKVSKYDEQGRGGIETLTMVRQSDQRPVELVKMRAVTEQELAILFVSLLDRRPVGVHRLNDEFEFRSKKYKVVDISGKSVVIQDTKSGESVTISMITDEERREVSGRSAPAPAPAAPPAAAEVAW